MFAGQLYRRPTIDVLPDDVLLEVFNSYLGGDHYDAWHKLVHVCQRWQQLVFASPCQLNLRLFFRSERSVKKLLDIWPALPIVIGAYMVLRHITNVEAALEHNDRICEIDIRCVPNPLFDSMKKPFPALTSLKLQSHDNSVLVLPDSFLDGSAPRLRTIFLSGIPFSGLPKLLLSAHHLVDLSLWDIPYSGYISPEAMVTGPSSLVNLKLLWLAFRRTLALLDQTNRHQPPLTRTLLPSLTCLSFSGDSEYSEDIVARIHVPLLNEINITFFNQLMLGTPLFRSFISRTEALKAFDRANILLSRSCVRVTLLREGLAHNRVPLLAVACHPLHLPCKSSPRRE